MAENHRRVVTKRIVKNVNVGTADATKRDLHFDLMFATRWLRDIQQVDVAVAGRMLHDGFHWK
jgi:hypothetical protein